MLTSSCCSFSRPPTSFEIPLRAFPLILLFANVVARQLIAETAIISINQVSTCLIQRFVDDPFNTVSLKALSQRLRFFLAYSILNT